MYKEKLLNIDEIIGYESDQNSDMNEESMKEFIENNFGHDCQAILVELDVDDVIPGDDNANVKNDKTQKQLDKAKNLSPILVSKSLEVIDGHHRLRAAIYQKREKILAYQIIPGDD